MDPRDKPEGDNENGSDGGAVAQAAACRSTKTVIADRAPWLDVWSGLVDFEVVEVTDSAAAAKRFGR